MTVQSTTATEKDFVIERIYDAKPARVFKAWTDPQQLAQWWGPREFTGSCEMDFRGGGAFRITMHATDGTLYPMTGAFREIIEPTKLVWVQSCVDHPPEWHELINKNVPGGSDVLNDVVVTITFEEQQGKTKLTVRMHFDSAEDRDALVKFGMHDGWSQSLDKLKELLAKV
jgi:uncharacterized protein YndB with AHSA1/START domain